MSSASNFYQKVFVEARFGGRVKSVLQIKLVTDYKKLLVRYQKNRFHFLVKSELLF